MKLLGKSIGGFELTNRNSLEILDYDIPFDWEIQANENKLIAYLMGEALNKDIIITFSDNIKLQEILISDILGKNIDPINLSNPNTFELLDIYPNPFNPFTTVAFDLIDENSTKVEIYNVMGQIVDVLHDGFLASGHHAITWNAENHVSGVYFINIQSGFLVETKKVMLLK